MSGHSFLYLGQGDFAADYLSELETLPCCTCLTRSANFSLPDDVSYIADVVLLDAGPGTHFTESSLSELVRLLAPYPIVALTNKAMEQRGITAVRAGAEGYICVDDVTVEDQESLFDHAVQRRRLQSRLSDTDVTVLSVLRNINDGVIVVDAGGAVLDINPAARSILGLKRRTCRTPTGSSPSVASMAMASRTATRPTCR